MLFLFKNQPDHLVDFATCTVLCGIYFLTNYLLIKHILKKYGKGIKASAKSLLESNIYALVMSIPVMPFVFSEDIDANSITIFALSYLLWQTLCVSKHSKSTYQSTLIPLSLTNLAAWVATALVGYWFYTPLAKKMSVVLLGA